MEHETLRNNNSLVFYDVNIGSMNFFSFIFPFLCLLGETIQLSIGEFMSLTTHCYHNSISCIGINNKFYLRHSFLFLNFSLKHEYENFMRNEANENIIDTVVLRSISHGDVIEMILRCMCWENNIFFIMCNGHKKVGKDFKLKIWSQAEIIGFM